MDVCTYGHPVKRERKRKEKQKILAQLNRSGEEKGIINSTGSGGTD